MDDEISTLYQNNTWKTKLIDPDPSYNVLSCKWVFRWEMDENGNIDRLKARLVANGIRQLDRINVDEIFSSVIKPLTVKIILTCGWQL